LHILQYSVRIPVLLKYFGQLCIVLAALSFVPLTASLLFGDYDVSIRYGIVITAISIVGISCSRLQTTQRMQNNEAMVITAAIFLFSSLMMTWPVMASGLSFNDALFETISAVTTTGLSTAVTMADKTPTFLFSRAWMQWIGGLGIVVLCMATLIQPGLTGKRLNISENFQEDIIGGTRAIARRVLLIYSIITILGISLLILSGESWFNSVLYALAAVSTGGFAPHDSSLLGMHSQWAQIIVITLSMAGGISLLLYYQAYHEGRRYFWHDRQLQAFLVTAAAICLLMTWFLWHQDNLPWREALQHGTLNGLSAISTAGFSSVNTAEVGSASKLTLILAMAVGGCTGSTAGGIKIIRLLILFRLLYHILEKAGAPPHAVVEARLNNKKLGADEMLNAMSLFVLFVCVTTLSWLSFLSFGYAPLDSLFEVVSALGTAGLSTGITSVELHPFLKMILCINMLFGRLEIVAWLVFLHPGTWFGIKKED